MTTAIYVRISQDPGLTRAGVTRQREDCEALCKRRKWGRIVVYEDNDVSAYSGRKRPAYTEMMVAVEAGDVDHIVAWHTDRLHRSPRELEDFIDAIELAGVAVATVTAGDYDLATPSGRAMARHIGAAARYESEQKSLRVRRKHLELAQAGAWSGGGTRPFGYQTIPGPDGKRMLVVDHAEADIIRTMMDRYLAGQSARSIAAWLRDTGVPTVNKGQWRTNTVVGILTGAIIAGQREHLGRVVGDAQWPRIVTPDQVAKARAITATNPARPRRDTATLLAGLCRCGRCNNRMHAGRSKTKTVLRCPPPPNGCGRVSILRHDLEQAVVATAFTITDKIRLPEPKTADRAGTRILRDAEKQLDELATAYGNKIISLREWLAAREPIEQRVAAVTTQQADTRHVALLPFAGKPGALRNAWDDLDHGTQQAILRGLIDTITIRPGVRGRKTFDPDRVTINWRD